MEFPGGGQNSIYSEFPVVNEKQSGIHSIGDQEKFVRTIFPGSNFCDGSNFFVLSGIFMGQISNFYGSYVCLSFVWNY